MDVGAFWVEAEQLQKERAEFMEAKGRKAMAEDEVLETIVRAARCALPAIATRVEGVRQRAVDLGGGLFLGEQGDFFAVDGRAVRPLSVSEVLEETTPAAILAVLTSAVRAQAGKLSPRTAEIRREAGILEGIAAAFRAGGVR